jgi:hypothetical protein
MALTPEDGTGLANADALISLAYANTYHSERGNSTWTGDDADKESAIRRASFYLSNHYDWIGLPLNGRTQALAWPRTGVVDGLGYAIESSEIPKEVKQACAEAALRELVSVGSLTPDYTPSERLESAKVGPVSVTYANNRTDSESSRPILLIVRDLISQYLEDGGSTTLIGRANRG